MTLSDQSRTMKTMSNSYSNRAAGDAKAVPRGSQTQSQLLLANAKPKATQNISFSHML